MPAALSGSDRPSPWATTSSGTRRARSSNRSATALILDWAARRLIVRLSFEQHLLKRGLYAAVAEHEAAPIVTVMVEPAVVFQRRIVTDPALSVSSLQLCPPSEAVASTSGWFEVT
jgi:hypothetical protein